MLESPRAFPPADYEGLRVDPEAWPPLLHPRMLMDPDGYSAWERHMVARCNTAALSPESVLATLARDARGLRRYRPESGSLTAAVAALPAATVTAVAPEALDGSLCLHALVLSAVPEDIRPAPDEE